MLFTSDWVGPALAVAEVPQKLVDAVVAEGPGQDRVLHLLLTKQGYLAFYTCTIFYYRVYKIIW